MTKPKADYEAAKTCKWYTERFSMERWQVLQHIRTGSVHGWAVLPNEISEGKFKRSIAEYLPDVLRVWEMNDSQVEAYLVRNKIGCRTRSEYDQMARRLVAARRSA